MNVELTAAGSASDIADAVRHGKLSATATVEQALRRIAAINPRLHAFTGVVASRALGKARQLDAALSSGSPAGPLAGVPFAVKNLFDIEGLRTLAGARINQDCSPASRDAAVIARLEAAGAILVGALAMGEYAFDFAGRNAHYGHMRNPHDLKRISGGSSSGPGAAVAAGLVPIALGSDTNGSIRVPASFCGVFGLKPSFGRLSRRGTFPFVSSLDHVGPMARSVRDLALAYDAMQGGDCEDNACAGRPFEPATSALEDGIDDLRLAVAGGYFLDGCGPEAKAALARAAAALHATRDVEFPESARARAAAFVITAAEAGSGHLHRLRTRAGDYDPETRPRFIAGALVPAAWVHYAQRFRHWYARRVAELFKTVDVVLAPATPIFAPEIDQATTRIGDKEVPVRAIIGLYTQPISFIGLPVVAVPVAGPGMPIGIQVIGRPWEEASVLRVAAVLERQRIAAAPVAVL